MLSTCLFKHVKDVWINWYEYSQSVRDLESLAWTNNHNNRQGHIQETHSSAMTAGWSMHTQYDGAGFDIGIEFGVGVGLGIPSPVQTRSTGS